jgi:hypothetical protein
MEFKIDNDCSFDKTVVSEFCSPEEIVDKLKQITQVSTQDEMKEKYNCDTEVCILNHPEVKQQLGHDIIEDIFTKHFKPLGPRDNNKWFNNTDIDSVLEQIQRKYTDKHFLHIEFQMSDFEKTGTALATLDWPSKYKEGFRSFGTVFNTDTSSGSGEHWFAVFACFDDNANEFTIEYFNSSGELPMNPIAKWMKRVKHEWQIHFDKPISDVVVTRIVNQEDNWNCGSYSLYYIISRLDGVPYQYFKNNKIGDEKMQLFRKFLFRRG